MIPLIKRMIENDPEFRPRLPEIVEQLERLSVVLETDAYLGKGAEGFVFKGKFRSQVVAIKRILLDLVNHSREVEAMKQLDHPNVLKLLRSQDQGEFR
jgi:predicted Ser/Thr protein kinase